MASFAGHRSGDLAKLNTLLTIPSKQFPLPQKGKETPRKIYCWKCALAKEVSGSVSVCGLSSIGRRSNYGHTEPPPFRRDIAEPFDTDDRCHQTVASHFR
jgi:hypothetical protein